MRRWTDEQRQAVRDRMKAWHAGRPPGTSRLPKYKTPEERREAASERLRTRMAARTPEQKAETTRRRLATLAAMGRKPGPLHMPRTTDWCPEHLIREYKRLRAQIGAKKARLEILRMIKKEQANVAVQEA